MLRRLLSLILVLCIACGMLPAALAETVEMSAAQDTVAVYATLQRGDKDADDSTSIVMLQTKLIELGYLHDAADGAYGKNTENAVSAFQRIHGMQETGIADSATQEKLFNGTDLIPFVESSDPESVAFRTQNTLTMWGFVSSVPDGVLNSLKGDAIPDFKVYLKDYMKLHPTPEPAATATPEPVNPTGFADGLIAVDVPLDNDQTITQEVLDFVDGKYSFDVYRETLSNGDTGTEVLRLQRRLYNLKYLAIADGEFDANTERALLYFQKKNGLSQSAVADEATQRLLFSEAAVPSEEFINQYKFVIDESEQQVYVYQWNGFDYGTCIREMICSTGERSTPTPQGTFQASGPTGTGEWYYFNKYDCYAKWATRIVGGILFHSVTYSRGKYLNKTSVQKLGRRASHGCIRLRVEDALWTYEHCMPGTTVVVQD